MKAFRCDLRYFRAVFGQLVYTLVQPLLAFFKRLGKLSVVIWTGPAAQMPPLEFLEPVKHYDEGMNNP